MDTEAPKDKEEVLIRFGCGAFLGVITGLIFSGYYVHQSTGWSGFWIFTFTVSFGYLAVRQGDRFWLGLKNWFSWLF